MTKHNEKRNEMDKTRKKKKGKKKGRKDKHSTEGDYLFIYFEINYFMLFFVNNRYLRSSGGFMVTTR